MKLILVEIQNLTRIPVDAQSVFRFRNEYILKRNLIAWNFYDPINPSLQVDIIINFDLKGSHTKTIKTDYGDLKVLSKKDLIVMKRSSGRPQDLEDVKSLEAT